MGSWMHKVKKTQNREPDVPIKAMNPQRRFQLFDNARNRFAVVVSPVDALTHKIRKFPHTGFLIRVKPFTRLTTKAKGPLALFKTFILAYELPGEAMTRHVYPCDT